jgi:hypothetical protein
MSYHRLDIVISGAISPYLKFKPRTMPLDHIYYIVFKILCLSAGLSLWQQVLKMHYARYPCQGVIGVVLLSRLFRPSNLQNLTSDLHFGQGQVKSSRDIVPLYLNRRPFPYR